MFNIRPHLKDVNLKEIVGSSRKRNIVVGNKVLLIQKQNTNSDTKMPVSI